MIGSIGSTNPMGYGLLGQMITDSKNINNRLTVLTEQAGSGLISDTYAGLGSGAAVSLSLNPQLSAITTWQNNINQASSSMQVAQSAMTQIQSIASTFTADMNNLNGLNPSEVDSVASNARDALTQMANLLNTQDGNAYVFGGQDSANPPVPAPDNILSSNYYQAINAAVANLSAGASGASVAAATLPIGGPTDLGNSPFSSYMLNATSPPTSPLVQVGPNSMVQTGLLASTNSVAVSAGSSTTGSYMRDLMRALATIGSMSSSQVNDAGFDALVQDTRTSLTGAVTAMATDVGVLGERQAQLTATSGQLTDTTTALTTQVSSVQNVDMAQTLSELTQTQTQLQASYQLIAGENGLSLAKFLPAG